MEREAYQARMMRLAHLVSQPGWKDVLDYLHTQARQALGFSSAIDTPHKMAMAVGAYTALMTVAEWPSREIEATQKYLNDEAV